MLTRCTTSFGGTTLFEGEPRIRFARRALYVPQGGPFPDGIFDQDGALIAEGAFVRGIPDLGLVSQSAFTPLDPSAVRQVADEALYIYIGQLHLHFGHFLISTLSRLWPLRNAPYSGSNVKIVISNPGPVAAYLTADYAKILFGVLGLTADNFVNFDQPTILPHVVIPAPAMVENHCVYTELSRFFNDLGSRIAACEPEPGAAPVYLTKESVTQGVSHIVNEHELTAILTRGGVQVVAPEQLPFARQVALFRSHQTLCGLIGSAFHLSLFAPPGRYLMLNYGPTVWSNQLLVDACNGNQSVFLNPQADLVLESGDGSFLNHFRLLDPSRTADQLLRAIDLFHGRSLARPPRSAHTVDAQRRATKPLGTLVSHGKPASQSSHSHWSLGATSELDAAGGVSGTLTGSYQFHTAEEEAPWWQVDLLDTHLITGVTVYNREDMGGERANQIRIVVADTMGQWTEIARREVETSFGGLSGDPWATILQQPARARFIRVELLTRRHLHLDQVEVFGHRWEDLDAALD